MLLDNSGCSCPQRKMTFVFLFQGSGDNSCHFRVERIRQRGFVTFECMSHKGLFLGISPTGLIRSCVDTGHNNVRFYPEVVECKFNV